MQQEEHGEETETDAGIWDDGADLENPFGHREPQRETHARDVTLESRLNFWILMGGLRHMILIRGNNDPSKSPALEPLAPE